MDPKVPDIDPDVAALSPFTIPTTIGVRLVGDEDGQAKIETKIRQRAAEEDGGKLSKPTAYYTPAPFPTFFYEYKCESCRFYNQRDDDSGTCEVVGKPDDPLGGEDVHAKAWCALWMPVEGRGFFDWAKERVDPE